jgi:biotin transporter BioY
MDPYLAIRLQVLAVSVIVLCLGIAVIACFFRWIERKNGYKIGFLLFIDLLFLTCILGFIYLMAYRAEVVIWL